ncbi:hypothetical protein AWENTII_000448 [Aspergillus wentii]
MKSTTLSLLLSLLLLSSPVYSFGRNSQHPPGQNAILLSRVQALTLRGNRLTTSRRLSPIPQLTCVGPSERICNMYTIDTMRCTNQGFGYDEEDVHWTCTASLPQEFKLGSTDVVCEGFRDSGDKWVVKGSCGVEYRLLLTELGERRFGGLREDRWPVKGLGRKTMGVLGDLIFFGFMVACFVFILIPMFANCFGLRRNRRDPNAGHGGFWGGGGGGGGDGYDGPPPPYSSDPFASRTSQQGWRPGFWTGAFSGAAAGYGMGRRNQGYGSPLTGRRAYAGYGAGEGSSRSRSTPRFSSTSESTGFGSTRRR